MSNEHKAALAQGRREARAVKAYLEAVAVPKRRGRPVTPESLQARIDGLNERIREESDPLRRVDLIQARIDAETALENAMVTVDLEELEAGFVEVAKSYSERKGITYRAWRETGVAAATLKAAGIKQTRG